ncbi:hypothetical protein FOZ60_013281 [Perkinsus olseni]|uniref:Uncharacterized protein n=1 Tax=Perkinsus olseni TaxID=32597 RepID=A0A7J6NAM6_PEROL|nr:hypothetical protein FOZ60_013281 [Perkinsus olseni]
MILLCPLHHNIYPQCCLPHRGGIFILLPTEDIYLSPMDQEVVTILLDNTELMLVLCAVSASDLFSKCPIAQLKTILVITAALQGFLLSGQVQYRLQESCGQDCVTAWNDMMLPKLKKFQAKEAGRNGPNDVIPLAVSDMVTDFNGKLKAAKQAISRDVASLVKSRNPAAHSFSLAVTDEDIQGTHYGYIDGRSLRMCIHSCEISR